MMKKKEKNTNMVFQNDREEKRKKRPRASEGFEERAL